MLFHVYTLNFSVHMDSGIDTVVTLRQAVFASGGNRRALPVSANPCRSTSFFIILFFEKKTWVPYLPTSLKSIHNTYYTFIHNCS